MMSNENNQVQPIKPLATKIKGPQHPTFRTLRKTTPDIRMVSNLRVNRAIFTKPSVEEEVRPTPSIIRGEKLFEPSEELKQRLKRIEAAEAALTSQQLPPPEPKAKTPEERKKQLVEARTSYQEQIEKLRQKEQELEKAAEQTTQRLAELQNKLKEQEEQSERKDDLDKQMSEQQQRIKELEARHQNLQRQLASAQEKWKAKVAHLEKLKQEAETQSSEDARKLGQQVQEQQEKISLLKRKKNELIQRIQREETELQRVQNVVAVLTSQNKEKEALLRQQQQELEQLHRDKEKISRFANELVKKLAQVENLQRVESTITVAKKPPKKKVHKPKIIKAVPKAKGIPQLTNKPNAISGIVSDSEGQPLEGALVVIKNKQMQPQRALRTNKLGEFVVSSPLPNGTYHVETQKEGLNFDIMELELTGEILEPIEITPVS